MKALQKTVRYLTPFQWFEVLSVISFTLYFALIDKENPWWYLCVNALAAICGIFCVVLCAAGRKSQYYWGFVNIAAYIVIAWINRYYGEVMLNALYYLPTQFIGMFFWRRHYNEHQGKVMCKKMKPIAIIIFFAISALLIWLYHLFLSRLGGNATWLDSASTIFSLVANALMVMRYREQWLLWIIVDIITVAMWIMARDWIMTSMWSLYLLNACYGWRNWSILQSTANANNT